MDPRLLSEVVRLRGRVRELEAEVARLERAEHAVDEVDVVDVLDDARTAERTIELNRATPALR